MARSPLLLYRTGSLYEALDEALRHFATCDIIPESLIEVGLRAYDAEMRKLITKSWTSSASDGNLSGKVKGSINWYRHVDSTYTFMLREATFTGQCFSQIGPGLQTLAVTHRDVQLVVVDATSMQAMAEAATRDPAPVVAGEETGYFPRRGEPSSSAAAAAPLPAAAAAPLPAASPEGGDADEDDDDDLFEDDPMQDSRKRKRGEPQGDEDEELGSDDDDDDVLAAIGVGPVEPSNFVVAQCEKIPKCRNDKWRITLLGGIAHLNGRDFAFKKADAELS